MMKLLNQMKVLRDTRDNTLTFSNSIAQGLGVYKVEINFENNFDLEPQPSVKKKNQ